MEYKKEPINGFEQYQIDTNGIVYKKNGNPMIPSTNHNGYQIVNFYINGKRTGHSVHTLVANQFLIKNNMNDQVNHIDGDKTNNCVDNLEWVSPQKNIQHSVNVLGNMVGEKNHNSVGIIGVNQDGETIYSSNCIMDIAKIIACGSNINPKYVQNSIYRVLKGERKTYKNLFWYYK